MLPIIKNKMKMSKSRKNIFHSKMEKLALKLLNLNIKKNKNNHSSKNLDDFIKDNDSIGLFNQETKKDSLTTDYERKINGNNKCLEYKENFMNNNIDFLSLHDTENINSKEKSKIPKENERVPKIKGLDLIAKDYINKINEKKMKESSSSSIINNSSESLNFDINYDLYNKIYSIYEELKKEFDNLHDLISKNNNFEKEEDNIFKKIYFKCKVLGRDYYRVFLFGEEIQKIIKLFNYCLDIGKFIIYQIYLFLSLIYLDENIIMKNYIEMSYRTIIFYSSLNFQMIMNLIKNPQLSADPRIMNGIKTKNKIIISVLKLINPNVPTQKKIKEFIINDKINIKSIGKFPIKCLEEIEKTKNDINNNIYKEEENKNYNSVGIIKLIDLLKMNKVLIERLNEIRKEVSNLSLNNYSKKENNSKSLNMSRNIYINTNNSHPKEANFKTESFSSFNKSHQNNNIINNNYNNKKNFNNNKFLLPYIDTESNTYKFFIFFELDETLVHYFEEDNESYVKIRWGVEDCFSKIWDFCEISIVSTSSIEYTEKIVERFNSKGNYIKNKINKEDDEDNLDLSLINRDLNKCIFICHEEEFFNAPKNNILRLSEFQGDDSDREMLFLYKEIIKLKNENISDIRKVIPEMENNIRI